ncbi:uncharacterized protein [Littorina saxatilis]|uniref:uncharacterized protein n=1 Tax=Littorina saxatilis TaxID=31220 RepID=UPI0038B5AF69
MCQAGYYSITGYQPNCLPCPMGFISTTGAATSCQACAAGQTTRSQASTSCVTDGASVVCQNNPCENNGNCSVLLHDAYCTCEPGFTGRYCEQLINFCASSPCYNNATCFSSTQGFSCSCLSGFNGNRCEENINDCSLQSCNRKGTCIDQVNGFTCACLENYQGNQCEQQELRGCDIFPCGENSTCRNTNDYHRVCDCFPGFTGPLCDMEINECESQPCLNGGTCTDKVNGFECACRANFTGDRCELPVKLCAGVSCGIADSCVDDAVTGLPLCVCRSGYTQGELCKYSYNAETTVSVGTNLESQNVTETSQCRALCDARGDQCQAFVFRLDTHLCTLYSQVVSTVPVNTAVDGPTSLSVKRCSYPRDDFLYTEWFNTNNPRTGIELEAYDSIQAFGLTVCENTEPVDVECRVAATQGTIPAGVTCQLSGLQCTPSPSCPDMEIRYKCARSRVFEGKLCSVRDVCSERSTCATGSQCINDPLNPKGFSCRNCPQGYTGDLCQLTTDECAVQPCLNNGTCVDEFLTFSCNCPVGFEGNQCQTNPDDCVPYLCDSVGTQGCEDGLNDYTCVCRPGYTGKNCSVNIKECASNPCLHGATCVDQVNGYSCDCAAGWTGQRCETVNDLCSPFPPCSNGANCTTLFNAYSCSCPAGVYGTQCTDIPSLLQCNNNNPCVNTVDCSTNGIQAVCNCASDKEGVGCQFGTYYSCDNSPCQNGATCTASGAGVTCSCVSGYSGGLCEVNNDDCATTNCPDASATCIDGINQAYCRCPVGKASPTCSADIDENYDVCFSPSLVTAGAALPYALPVSNLNGFTVMVWVRYDKAGGSGTFLTMYTTSSASATGTRTEILRLDESGMNVNVFGNRTLLYNLFPINDGLWHLVVVFWNSATGDLDLTTDYLRQDRTRSYGRGQRITTNFLLMLGGTENTAASSTAFRGCVSGVNMLSRGLDFTADLPDLQSQPFRYRGDLLRWAEFQEYGNTRFARPSTARLVNCVANPSEPACVTQSRDSVAPMVTSCPDDIIVDTIFSDAYASWTPPTFTGGAVAVSASHQPGELFQRGSTAVVYVVEDQAGNTAVCTFTVFVGGTTCPAVDPPRGGGIQVCQLRSDNFDACSASCPAANATLVEDVPSYYSCGPSGLWKTLDDHGGVYPTCGRIVSPARADIQLHMNYQITTGQCSTITQGITTRSREDLTSMLQRWGGDMCRSSDCTDITPVVNCSTLSSTYVDIQLSNVSALMRNGLVQRSVEDVWEAAVLDNDIFRFDTIIPQAILNGQAYSVQVTYICEVGQVVREKMCVECGPGTLYNTSTLHCDNCPVGQYTSGYAAVSCTPCPQGQTTRSIGSTSVSDCAALCPVGQYHNGSRCALCPTAFYQNQTGQFECRPCPRGYLTLVEGSTSQSSCAEGCQSGYELLVNGTCVPCAQGTYRQYGLDQTCKPCRSGYTTPTDASISSDNCTVLRCPAGSKANASVTGCELCRRGQYQPQANQLGCLPCPTNYITAQPGSLQASDCQQFCLSGYQLVSGQCEMCPVASYKDNSVDPLTMCLPCPAGYLTAGPASTALAACSIRNCSAGFFIQSDNQGVETCALCPLDQYSSQPYQKSCTSCPSGTGTRQTGADDVSLCEVLCLLGEELVNGSCVQCAQGYYKDNSNERFAQCSVCPAEFITAGAGTTSLGDCNISNCSAGFFREVANNTCMECPLSTYQPDRWQTSCVACPTERLTEITGATSESQCLLSCSPGRQDQNGMCEPCPVGSYKNRTGAVSCYPCPPNLRTASNASTDVADCNIVACQPGSFLNATENTCGPCPYGQYQPDQWQSSCLPCPSGLTTLVMGATSSSLCLTDCQVGTELNVTANACEPCKRGYYRDKSTGAQISCELCAAAFITASTGSTAASDCSVANCTSPGRYLNTATNVCDMCPLGTYNSQWWAESCTSCPSSFTTKTDGISTVDSCYRDCPSGQQVDEASNVCSNCVIGTYRDKTQTWTCQPCPTPLTTLNPGSTAVNACDIPTCGPGLFYNSTQAQCLQCPMGTYQPQSAQRSCITCPDSRTTLAAGRTTVSDCVSACVTVQNACSSNADCSLDNSGDVVCTCRVNYQGDGQTCTHVCDLSTADYCKNGATCVKERDSPCLCASYYSGNRCETRADPSKATVNTEVIVGVVIGVVVFVMLLLLILIGIIVRRRGRKRASDKDSLSTSNTQSRPPSAIIPRMNTQNYRNFTPDDSFNKSYDPAYYHAKDRDVSSFAYDNATYR